MLTDLIYLVVQAGRGGNGCESYFHRLDRKVVPNGGDGGPGGNVIFRASSNAPGLDRLKLKRHVDAPSGTQGGSEKKRGRTGEDLVVFVPVGTRLYTREDQLMIRDLSLEGDEVIVAKGGEPGVGNNGGKEARRGQEGERVEVELEFFIVADVFIVGLPNSGKSALLHALTEAKVESKDYPFSTQSPALGVHAYEDYKQLKICEIPSVYEGSEDNRGLGTRFLKHLERAKQIVYMVDLESGFSKNLTDGLQMLEAITEKACPGSRGVPKIVVINKMDLLKNKKAFEKEVRQIKDPCFKISTKTGDGVDKVIEYLVKQAPKESHAK